MKKHWEIIRLFLLPAVVLTGWLNDNALGFFVGGPSTPIVTYWHWLPAFDIGEKCLIYGLCALVLIHAKPSEAYLFMRPQDGLIWKCWKIIAVVMAGLVVLECAARSAQWWMGGAGYYFRGGSDAAVWIWMPLDVFVFSLIFFAATKRCFVFLSRILK